MLRIDVQLRIKSFMLTLGLVGATLVASAPRTVAAAPPVESMSLVPADAAFYSATLRAREQYDLFIKSRAWRKIKNMPAVQMGMVLLQLQMSDPQSPLRQAQEMLEEEENQQLAAVLKDMVASEMFVYGSADFLDLIDLFQAINSNNQFGQIIASMQGDPRAAQAAQQQRIMTALLDNIDSLAIPDVVMGFKITDKDAATEQLARLEELLTDQLAEVPELDGALSRNKVAGNEYLTLKLTGQMIPWDEFDPEDSNLDPDDLAKLIDHVKEMTLEINIGIHGDYLIVSVSDDSAHLASLGQGDTLGDVEEMKKLAPHADQRLTGIGYASKELMVRASQTKEDLAGLNDVAAEALENTELDDDLKKRIKADVEELTQDMAIYMPEPGAVVSCAFMTDTGTESYTYSWGTNPLVDGSQPLSLLDHVGGAPLVACVSRGKYSPESYQTLVKWLKKLHGYFEDLAVPQMDAEDRQKYEVAWPQVVPLLKRLDQITGELFLPSMADGQGAFVIDAKLKSYHWAEALPATAVEMPLIEVAVVCGVTDAKKLIKAMGEYRTLVNDSLDAIEEISQGEAQTDFRLQAPEMRKFEFGDVYYYRLPEEAGVDKRLAPNAGLNDKVAAVSVSPRTTVRLLEAKPLEVEGLLASAKTKPAYSACYVDVAGLFDALSPWIDLGVRLGFQQFNMGAQQRQQVLQNEDEDAPEAGTLGDPANDSPTARQVLGQVHDVLEVLKVFRNYQSLSYEEDGVHVTHGQWRVVDVE